MEKFKDNEELSNFLLKPSDGIRPDNFTLPNHKDFVRWFHTCLVKDMALVQTRKITKIPIL